MFRSTVTALLLIALVSSTCNVLSASDSVTAIAAKDVNGPTVKLSYGKGQEKINPTPNFMYFVPLISPTMVECHISKNNNQLSKVISREVEIDGNEFYIQCEFQMWGNGTHQNTFDSTEMIKRNMGNLTGEKPLKNVLDYIKFNGQGYGTITAQGQIVNSKPVVQKVVVDFSSRDDKSPVTIGLYSINPINNEYKYENNFRKIVARIKSLSFERTDGTPRMAIKLSSVANDEVSNGFWGRLKGTIANFFINPITINPKGNDTMLDFGEALYQAQKSYTFPIAEKLKTAAKH